MTKVQFFLRSLSLIRPIIKLLVVDLLLDKALPIQTDLKGFLNNERTLNIMSEVRKGLGKKCLINSGLDIFAVMMQKSHGVLGSFFFLLEKTNG